MMYVAYLTLGDGGLDYTLACALALVEGGVTHLEIGLPFSDPIADGPVIQQAMERSLKAGTSIYDVIPFLQALRQKTQVPVILFSYYNPLRAAGPHFLEKVKEAGATGLLIIDLPCGSYPQCGLDPIAVVTPSTAPLRLTSLLSQGRGFIYYACQKGTTGARTALPHDFALKVQDLKRRTALPVVVGFGISSKEMAQEVLQYADGFVVGSYFVEKMGQRIPPQELTQKAHRFIC
jgi:tryptophan synthase alpha chain